MRRSAEQLAGPSEVPSREPRLLLFSYHFPPGQAAGALRWQMLTRYAAERGIGCDVLTVHPASLPVSDPDRLEQLPHGTRVFGVPIPHLAIEKLEHHAWRVYRAVRPRPGSPGPVAPAGATPQPPTARPSPGSLGRDEIHFHPRSVRHWLRAYYAWLEAKRDLGWGLAALRLGETLLEPGVQRAVVSCGPPHMPHEAARRLGRRAQLPFVMDLRDPWRLQQRLPENIASPLWFRLAVKWERRCVADAALVVTNTEAFQRRMQDTYPVEANRVIAVMNGYDEEPIPAVERDPRFLVAYAGSIYLDRDPRLLFRAGARVIREERLSPHQFGFAFLGNSESYGGVPVRQIAAEEGIAEFVSTEPQRPRVEAMAFLARATMLVSLPQDSDLAIPSKVFEYLSFDAWTLLLATAESATGRAVAGLLVDLADPGDVGAITEVLRRRWRSFAAGERPRRPVGVESLSRRAQAGRLFDALGPLMGVRAPGD